MRTRWQGKRVRLRMLDDSIVDVVVLSAYKELGETFLKVRYPSGDLEHIPINVLAGFIEEKPKKKAPVLRIKRRFRLVK